jgi:hypothetical protein
MNVCTVCYEKRKINKKEWHHATKPLGVRTAAYIFAVASFPDDIGYP